MPATIVRLFTAVLVLLLLLAPSDAPTAQGIEYSIVPAFPELPLLDRPTDLQHAPGYPSLLFVVEQPGRIRSLVNHEEASSFGIFLDITDRVSTAPSWEEGLLGLAFDPDFEENGYFYVYYTAAPATSGGNHRSIVARFTASLDDVPLGDPESEVILLDLEQLGPAHNGGQVSFGPDGYLYVSFGDGIWGSDPMLSAQDPSNLFGTIIRIDVADVDEVPDGQETVYSIPADNPFVEVDGYRPEIWAYGFRNPWRFSFDVPTGRLWVGDVGEAWIEEVNVVVEGGNYGWSTMSGAGCYNTPPEGAPPCNDPSLLVPIWEYTHADGDKSITGGFVYRGTAMPQLQGKYVYGDFISGRIWALDVTWPEHQDDAPDVVNELLIESGLQVTSFGVDASQELFMLDYFGRPYRLVTTIDIEPGARRPASEWLELSGPNPVRNSTTLRFGSETGGEARLVAYDMLGRPVGHLYTGLIGADTVESVAFDATGLAAGLYILRLYVQDRAAAAVRVTVVR